MRIVTVNTILALVHPLLHLFFFKSVFDVPAGKMISRRLKSWKAAESTGTAERDGRWEVEGNWKQEEEVC